MEINWEMKYKLLKEAYDEEVIANSKPKYTVESIEEMSAKDVNANTDEIVKSVLESGYQYHEPSQYKQSFTPEQEFISKMSEKEINENWEAISKMLGGGEIKHSNPQKAIRYVSEQAAKIKQCNH